MRGLSAWLLLMSLAAVPVSAAQAQEIDVREDGSVAMPALDVPGSRLMSDEGNRSRVEHILTERSLKGKPVAEFNAALFGPRLERTKAAYDVSIKADRIAGVPVLIYEPKGGIAPAKHGRLLVNVHGGGFVGCFVECGGMESIPVAALTGMRVVSIDYRLYPAATFPAASEDVETVYRELLKTTPAARIGVYGCSAGGVLTAQSLARFQAGGLPPPGAAGIFCAGSDPRFDGDSMRYGMVLGDGEMPRAHSDAPLGYMRGAAPGDPTAYPSTRTETLAAFPPTLVMVGTRDFAVSGAVKLHSRLVALGVDARLHMWEGGRHAFFYDIRVPESREVFDVAAKFFLAQLK